MPGSRALSLVDRTPATVEAGAGAVPDQAGTRRARWRPAGLGTRRDLNPDARFWLCMLGAVGLGAVVRFVYLFHAAPAWVAGDGFDYFLVAHRLADGLGYTSALGVEGQEYAHHPPAWASVLAAVTKVGVGS